MTDVEQYEKLLRGMDNPEPVELSLAISKWTKYRYLVFCYYPNLRVKIRVTGYNSKRDMYEYLSGVRMCDTPYQAIDKKTEAVIDRELFGTDPLEIQKLVSEIMMENHTQTSERR